MALAADSHRETGDGGVALGAQVVNASQLYAGSFVALGHASHGTAANVGRLYPYNDEAGAIPYGLCPENQLGDTTASPPVEAVVQVGPMVVRHLTVSGVTAVTQRGEPVYLTDDGTFTLTAPALAAPWGMVDRFRSSGVADVLFFGLGERLALCGIEEFTALLGYVDGAIGASADVFTGVTLKRNCVITGVYGIVCQPLTGGGADIDVNLEIDGTNVTGGVIEWLATDARAAKKAGTAITASTAIVRANSLVDGEAVVNSAGTGGLMAIYAECRTRWGT